MADTEKFDVTFFWLDVLAKDRDKEKKTQLRWIPRIGETVIIDEQDFTVINVFYNIAFEAVDIEIEKVNEGD